MSRALSVGLNAFSEFVGAVVAGGLIGWQADEWLGSKPWLMVVFLGLGVAAGFWNIYRLAKASQGDTGET
jgi:ATP synthase protein I